MKVLLTTAAFVLMAGVASAATVTIETATSGTALKSPAPLAVGGQVPGEENPENPDRPNIEFGQLFTATEDAILYSFGFAIDDSTVNSTAPLDLVAKVTKVDDLGNLMDDQFSYEASFTTSGTNFFDPREVHVLESEFVLEAGMTYAIIFEATGGGPIEWGYFENFTQSSPGDAYEDGYFIFSGGLDNGYTGIRGFDSDFEVTYKTPEVVPVAGALPLLATGLAAFGVAGLRRRRKS